MPPKKDLRSQQINNWELNRERWLENISVFSSKLNNLRILPYTDLDKKKETRPVLIVGPSPSLAEEFWDIAQFAQQICIISVDVSLNALLDIGVIPDWVVSVDSHPQIEKALEKIPPNSTNLLASSLVNPEIWELPFKEKYAFNEKQVPPELIDLMAEKRINFPSAPTGLSVAFQVFWLANQLKAPRIYYTGLDFSYPLGLRYSPLTFLVGGPENFFNPSYEAFNYKPGEKTLVSEGVMTDMKLLLFREVCLKQAGSAIKLGSLGLGLNSPPSGNSLSEQLLKDGFLDDYLPIWKALKEPRLDLVDQDLKPVPVPKALFHEWIIKNKSKLSLAEPDFIKSLILSFSLDEFVLNALKESVRAKNKDLSLLIDRSFNWLNSKNEV